MLDSQNNFHLPSLIGDHMVLQSGTARLWGRDKPGQQLEVMLAGRTFSGQTDAEGHWTVDLPGLEPGGPYEAVIRGTATVVLKDVLIGEVWLGSGQSNMEMTLKETSGAAEAVAAASHSGLRLFLQARAMGLSPLREALGHWVVCSPETAKHFSAAAYYFGRELMQDLQVPVGLIVASWGGSFIESWIPYNALTELPAQRQLLQDWESRPLEQRQNLTGTLNPDLCIAGLKFIPRNSDMSALNINVLPSSQNNRQFLGGFWRGEANEGSQLEFIPAAEQGPGGEPAGRITGSMRTGDWGFITTSLKENGEPFDLSRYRGLEFDARGEGDYFIFLPQPSIKDGCNWSSHPFKVTREWKTYRIDFDQLKQDAWGEPAPFTQHAITGLAFGVASTWLSNFPSVMFNGMITPATRFPLRGVLWYQGESNEWTPTTYQQLLHTLITSWRRAWGSDDLAFLICQLPEFRTRPEEPAAENWPVIREAQAWVTKLPNVEMAVLLGLGDAVDIHPRNKKGVGERLAKTALHAVYGKEVAWTGPRYESMIIEGPKIRIRFKYAEQGLKTSGGPPQGFSVAGRDEKQHWARAIIEGSSVLVWCDAVSEPAAVRYAWADNPEANLLGENGLPVAPFRTDEP